MIDEIAQVISNYGFSVVLLAWMIYKDYKFNDSILAIMREVKEVLVELRTWHNVEDSTNGETH